MASDNIKVAIRVRSRIQKELAAGQKSKWTVDIKENSIFCDDPGIRRLATPYVFDRVFDEMAITEDIFEDICRPIVDSALAGFNGTIFAYGQSSSGKTFTITGSRVQPGIINLAVDEIFRYIANIPDREFLIRVGYLEIYNEKLSDLLSDDDNPCKLQEDADHNIQVIGLTEEMVTDTTGVNMVLERGNAKRHTAETKQNDRSSRSHCILRIVIESRLAGHEDDAVNVSNLYFVDLAGSEKAGDNSGDRFKEGCAINKSLFTLGMVIRMLSGDTSHQYVSFRDSKLTRILQNALGGNSKTAIICTIAPVHIEQTESTLKFASRAKKIKNKAIINEVMSDAAMLKNYRLKIRKLQEQIKDMSDTNTNMERAELEKRLEEKDEAERQQAEMIAKLQAMIVTSGCGGIGQEQQIKKRRRETWCPGKTKREFRSITRFPPHIAAVHRDESPSVVEDDVSLMTTVVEDSIFEDEDSFQLLENIPLPGINTANNIQQRQPDPYLSMQINPTIKELFELQDKHEQLLEDIQKKDADFEELVEFTSLERKMDADQIRDLKKRTQELETVKASVPWLENELMKVQAERNGLRQKFESMNAVEDGTGITTQYEFHIKRLKMQLETCTMMLKEKGVDFESIKARLSLSDSDNADEIIVEKKDEIAELKAKNDQEINDLRNEVDILVLALEREKKHMSDQQEQFELEFEDQKVRFQKDINESREEIEIYQQMLEEKKEKVKRTNANKNNEVNVNNDSRISVLKHEIELQQHTYEAEIAKIEVDLEEKKIKTFPERETKASQTDKVQKHVNFDYSSELENQKERYESMIKELTEERYAYQTVLEETKMIESIETTKEQACINIETYNDKFKAQMEELEENHKMEIEYMKAEFEKFAEEHFSSNIEKSDSEGLNMKNVNEIKELKRQLEELKENIESEEQTQLESRRETRDVSLNTSYKQDEENRHDTDEMKKLKQDLNACQKCLEEQRETGARQTAHIDAANEQHKEYETTIMEIQDDLSNMMAQLQQLANDIEILQAANARLKQEKLNLQHAKRRQSRMSGDHEGTIQALQQSVKELQDSVRQMDEDNIVLKARGVELEKHISIDKGMLNSRDEEIRALKDELEEQRISLDREKQERVQEWKKFVNELEGKVQDSEDALRQANETHMKLEECKSQFSDTILNLESTVDLYKEKEEELSNVCTEYEEKIVNLETDIETVKGKNSDMENLCSDQEKRIHCLMEDLELAQNKDIELKEIQCRYQDKISDLENKLKQSTSSSSETETIRNELVSKIKLLSQELETAKEQLIKEVKEKDQEREEVVVKLHNMDDKVDIYAESIIELQDEIKLNNEEIRLLHSRLSHLEADSQVATEMRNENDLLKVKLECMELDLMEKSDCVSRCESEIESLKDKMAVAVDCSIGKEEVERIENECTNKVTVAEGKVAVAEEKVKVIEVELDEIQIMTETLKHDKEYIEKRLEVVEAEKQSIEEDNMVLERGLHPISVKYHSQPKNIDWEKKWNDFAAEEKKKRLVVFGTFKQLNRDIQTAQNKEKRAFDIALERINTEERKTDIYKNLYDHVARINQEADKLFYELEDEQELTKELKEKLEASSQKSNVDFMTEDHPCKFKLECFSATEALMRAQVEHAKRTAQYEETIQQYEDRISRMRHQMRRMNNDMDTTFDGRSDKMADTKPPSKWVTPAGSANSMPCGSSMSGGIIDHFKVCITEAENKNLKQELDKQSQRILQVDGLELENTKVKGELQKMKDLNSSLKETLRKYKETVKEKDFQRASLKSSRHPLTEMCSTSAENKSSARSRKMEETEDEVDGCKTS